MIFLFVLMEYLLFRFGLSISLASFDEVFALVIHMRSFYYLIQNLTLPIVLTGFFYPCDLNLEVLSLRLGFNLVIHIDGVFSSLWFKLRVFTTFTGL